MILVSLVLLTIESRVLTSSDISFLPALVQIMEPFMHCMARSQGILPCSEHQHKHHHLLHSTGRIYSRGCGSLPRQLDASGSGHRTASTVVYYRYVAPCLYRLTANTYFETLLVGMCGSCSWGRESFYSRPAVLGAADLNQPFQEHTSTEYGQAHWNAVSLHYSCFNSTHHSAVLNPLALILCINMVYGLHFARRQWRGDCHGRLNMKNLS